MKQSSSFRPVVGDKAEASAGEAAPSAARQVDASVGGEARSVVNEPIDVVGLLAGAQDPGAGAIVLFSGEVRDNNRGREVVCLEYEAHVALAEKMMMDIVAAAKERWKLTAAVAQHRIGRVEVGESAVVVITASVHRGEAYAANRHIIDRIKHEAPIWKCEHYADGTKEWGNNCNCREVTGDVMKHIYESDG